MSNSEFKRDLGNGLLLRHAIPADVEQVVEMNGLVHTDPGTPPPDKAIMNWTRDLFAGIPPGFLVEYFTVVEDTHTEKIVSSCCLIPQTWTYAGVPFGVGRIELVGTLPDYRRRGLIRAQFERLHQMSADEGDFIQAITGIPNYYRQFGYAMAVSLSGGRTGYRTSIPALAANTEEPYRFRKATTADIPLMSALYVQGGKRWLLACVRDEIIWKSDLERPQHPNSPFSRTYQIIETPQGEPIGFFAHRASLFNKGLVTNTIELKAGVSWRAVIPSVLRYLAATGEAYAQRDSTPEKPQSFERYLFQLGADHSIYQAVPELLPQSWAPYAWYLRVPDLVRFLTLIAPVLETRLAGSIMAGHSGDLKLNFYGSGLQLHFEQGKLSVMPWTPTYHEDGNANFPDQTFLNVLFGHRTLAEVGHIFADCFADDGAKVLLNILFPKQESFVSPIA